jgi:hypothetical protein
VCLIRPARVVEVAGDVAILEMDGRRWSASILLEPTVGVGDWVMAYGGAVLRRVGQPPTGLRRRLGRRASAAAGGDSSVSGRPTKRSQGSGEERR